MIDIDYLDRLQKYITEGDCEFEFDNGDEEQRHAILDGLEKIMDIAEHADELATKLIFKGGLGALAEVVAKED